MEWQVNPWSYIWNSSFILCLFYSLSFSLCSTCWNLLFPDLSYMCSRWWFPVCVFEPISWDDCKSKEPPLVVITGFIAEECVLPARRPQKQGFSIPSVEKVRLAEALMKLAWPSTNTVLCAESNHATFSFFSTAVLWPGVKKKKIIQSRRDSPALASTGAKQMFGLSEADALLCLCHCYSVYQRHTVRTGFNRWASTEW